jgi:tRNA (mo5U34)-methyltransferase
VEEQRPTDWGPGPSYAGALDPSDARKTIEGHPAPERFLVSARSKGLQ